MSRDFDLMPIVGPNSLANSNLNHQTLMSLNQSGNIIEEKLPSAYSAGERFNIQQQQQNTNKLRDQKLRCYLCETPKQEYSLIMTCGEFVCRGCFNYEGKDRVEQLIENARQFKFAHHLVHNSNNNNNNNDNSINQILKSTTMVQSGDPPLLRPLNKQSKSSLPNLNRSSNGLNNSNNNVPANISASTANNKGLKEPQQRRSSSKEKFGEQLNKTDNGLSGQKRSNWRQTEAQQMPSMTPISSDGTTSNVAKVSLPSIKQSKTVLPTLNDDFLNNQIETKPSSSSAAASSSITIQKHPLNQQQSVVYKQKLDNGNGLIEPKFLSNTTIVQNPSLYQTSSSSDIFNQINYKTITNEEQDIDGNSLSLQQIEQIQQQQQQNRLPFDSNNLTTYPLLFSQNNLSLGGSQDNYHHPSLFRHPTNMALQAAPNTTAVYHQAHSQDLLARMSVGGGNGIGNGGKRGRSTFNGNQCNNLNGQNFSFGSYSIMPTNILYQPGANLQGLYGSPGSIYATYHSPYQQHQQQQQQQHQKQKQQQQHPLSPSLQSSNGQQHKSPSLLASPTYSFSSDSSSNNSFGNYASLVQHPKGAQVILDPRLRNLASNQEQREALNNQQTNRANFLGLQFLDSNNTLPIEQQSNNRGRHQNITKEQATFERNQLSPVTSPTHKSSIRDQTINGSLSNIDHVFMGSQQNPIQTKQSQSVPHIPLSSRSSLVKSLHMYQGNNPVPTSSSSSSSSNNAKQQRPYSRESKTVDVVRDFDPQKPGKGGRKTGRSPDKSSSKHNNIEEDLSKQKETPTRSTSQHTKESASILRQKLSDQRLNKASSRNNISEQLEDTIVIDVEEETDIDKTINITTSISSSSSSSRRNISDTNNSNDNNNQFSSFKQPSSCPQQSSNSQPLDSVNQASTEDRLISRQTTSNFSSIPRNVDNVYPGSSESCANPSPETINNHNDNNEQAPSCDNVPGLKLNCLICSKNLVDRHFVQCPSVLSHKFCFSCTRNSISEQREKHKLRVGEEEKIYCLSGKMCPLIGQKEPWTFMTSEVETIFREKNKRSDSPDQVKNSSSSSPSPSQSNQQKFKRKSKSNNDERIKKRVLIEPSNRKIPPSKSKSFDPNHESKHD